MHPSISNCGTSKYLNYKFLDNRVGNVQCYKHCTFRHLSRHIYKALGDSLSILNAELGAPVVRAPLQRRIPGTLSGAVFFHARGK